MIKQSKIRLHAYRGTFDAPEIVTVTFDGATTLDHDAAEFWRKAVSKFYGNARVILGEDDNAFYRQQEKAGQKVLKIRPMTDGGPAAERQRR